MKITVAYTHSEALRPLLFALIKDGHEVQIYNPKNDFLNKKIDNIMIEIEIIHQDKQISTTNKWGDVVTSAPDAVIVLNMDIVPSMNDSDFFIMCKAEFKKKLGIPNLTPVIFGKNYRGLIAAQALHNSSPGLDIMVVSSIIKASREVHGDGFVEKTRGISTMDGKIFIKGEDQGIMEKLVGFWSASQFCHLEGKAIIEAVSELDATEKIKNLEFVGRIPSKVEITKYKLKSNIMTWLPCGKEEGHVMKGEFLEELRKISEAISEIVDQNTEDNENN